MNVKIVRATDGAIEFHAKERGGMFYDISKHEQGMGFDFWRCHLANKRWFDDGVFKQFEKVWGEHVR